MSSVLLSSITCTDIRLPWHLDTWVLNKTNETFTNTHTHLLVDTMEQKEQKMALNNSCLAWKAYCGSMFTFKKTYKQISFQYTTNYKPSIFDHMLKCMLKWFSYQTAFFVVCCHSTRLFYFYSHISYTVCMIANNRTFLKIFV